MVMEKLYQLFHIEKLLICGGGTADWTFLQAGMVDELSLVLSPVTDGSNGFYIYPDSAVERRQACGI